MVQMIINVKRKTLIKALFGFIFALFFVFQGVRVIKNWPVFGKAPDFFIGDDAEENSRPVSENDFSDGKGIISVSCSKISQGGVYVYVNGTIEASLTSEEARTLRVAVGDVIIVMGHDLISPAEVFVDTAVGRIDCSIQNYKLSVGNKGKLLAVIKNFEI